MHKNLDLHPRIWLPKWKELHFFDRLHRRRPGWMDAVRPHAGRKIRTRLGGYLAEDISHRDWRAIRYDLRFYLAKRDVQWYSSLFHPRGDQVAGEITPGYSTLTSERVRYIASLGPELKLLFVMCNPIERTWSAAVMGMQQETGLRSGYVGLKQLRALTEMPSIELRDNYVRTLDIWSQFFQPERMFIGFLEDISFRPQVFLSNVFDFLGVEDLTLAPGGKEHARSGDTMPLDVARYLAERHLDLMTELARRFGGLADIAEWLLGDAVGSRVAYPLWNTSRGGAAGGELRYDFASSPLSLFTTHS